MRNANELIKCNVGVVGAYNFPFRENCEGDNLCPNVSQAPFWLCTVSLTHELNMAQNIA